MLKAAGIVLAASLVLPLVMTGAAPPGPAEPAGGEPPDVDVRTLRLPSSVVGGPLHFDLPGALANLPPEDRARLQVQVFRLDDRAAPKWPGGICLAERGEESDNFCAAAARIAREKPCLAAGDDCPAYEAWQEVMGTPGIRPAPRSMVRAADRSPERVEPPERD